MGAWHSLTSRPFLSLHAFLLGFCQFWFCSGSLGVVGQPVHERPGQCLCSSCYPDAWKATGPGSAS